MIRQGTFCYPCLVNLTPTDSRIDEDSFKLFLFKKFIKLDSPVVVFVVRVVVPHNCTWQVVVPVPVETKMIVLSQLKR